MNISDSAPKIFSYQFIVEPFHVDFTGHVNLSHICDYMLYAAESHAEILGCGLEELLTHNLSWFLTRAVIEIDKYPKAYEKGKVETWVEQTNRLFSIRNIDFFDEDNKRFGGARLMWALVDLTTHTPADLSTLEGLSQYSFPERKSAVAKPAKVPDISAAASQATPQKLYDVASSDIDFNQHFNSVKYIEKIVDMFSLDDYRTSQIERLEINYVAEAKFGATLALRKEVTQNPECWTVSMRDNTSAETICRARVSWKKRND